MRADLDRWMEQRREAFEANATRSETPDATPPRRCACGDRLPDGYDGERCLECRAVEHEEQEAETRAWLGADARRNGRT